MRAGQVVNTVPPSFSKAACLAVLSFMLRPLYSRPFSTSLSRSFPRQLPARATSQSGGDIPRSLRQAAQTEDITSEDFKEAQQPIHTQWSLDDIVENENDSSSTGHLYLAQQRQNLHYLRLIEHEMPKLVGEWNRFHASLDYLTARNRTYSLSQTVQPSDFRNPARCPVHVLSW
jgi:hypothetical protein